MTYNDYKGRKYKAEIHSDKYLSIEPDGDGFDMKWVQASKPFAKLLEDEMLLEWLDDPVAYGAFDEDGKLICFVEGSLEEWNNRYRTPIYVFLNLLRVVKALGRNCLPKSWRMH